MTPDGSGESDSWVHKDDAWKMTWKPCWDDTGQRVNSSKALEGDKFKRSKEKKQTEAEKAASLLQLTQQSLREQDDMVNGEIKEETGQCLWTECLCWHERWDLFLIKFTIIYLFYTIRKF